MKTTLKCFATIRRACDDHHEFIEMSSISNDRVESRIRGIEMSRSIPQWGHDNPIRRVVAITITED